MGVQLVLGDDVHRNIRIWGIVHADYKDSIRIDFSFVEVMNQPHVLMNEKCSRTN